MGIDISFSIHKICVYCFSLGFLRMPEAERGPTVEPCRSNPCREQQESLCQTSWALTSREIYRPGCLTGNFFRPWCRSIVVAVGVLTRCHGSEVQGPNKWTHSRVRWVCQKELCVCPDSLPVPCAEALCKVAWIRKWFCPPTGTDLKTVCRERMKCAGISCCFSCCCCKRLLLISSQCATHWTTSNFPLTHNTMFKWHSSAIDLCVNNLIFSVGLHIV